MEEIRIDQSVSSQLKENKNNSFLVTLLSVLLLISVFIAGFFAWKTQKLVKDLRSINEDPKPTPVATTTPDPTANWKTFSDKNINFSFKYPSTLTEKIPLTQTSQIIQLTSDDNSKLLLSFLSDKSKVGIPCGQLKLQENVQIGSIKTIKTVTNPTDLKKCLNYDTNQEIIWIKIKTSDSDINNSYDIQYSYPIDKSENNMKSFDEILSTFKFTESDTACTPLPECAYNTDPKKPTCKIGEKPFEGGVWCPRPTENPTQTTACTMDAKICPDGSAVGRSGPKCEFAACPTTSPRP